MAEFETHQNRAAEAGAGEAGQADPWLSRTRNAYRASLSFVDTNLRRAWENNLRAFQSQHPTGSKYYSGDYKHRSKIFRPKTRSTIRKLEAAAAAAFFSTNDVLSIKATDDNDPRQKASALINKELVQHHLTKSVPWFLTLLGAWQDGQVQGICVSRQTWLYEEREIGTEKVPKVDILGLPVLDEAGLPVLEDRPVVKVVKDHPIIDLLPIENLRVDPGADWRDPINSSPYLLAAWPMYVTEVRDRIRKGEWKKVDDGQLAAARESQPDSTRAAREQGRTDSKEVETGVRDFDIVWVLENFMRIDGEDTHYFTLATNALLTDPKPAEEVYPHAPRPYVMGLGAIETHKVYPASKVEQVGPIQQEANEVANQRLDNVKLAMNGRYFVRRGKQVDLASLLRSSPGSATMMNDPESDVVVHRPPDVTASSYAEQDRINVDFDELAGSFSAGSVQTNRQLNETVGGMNLLSASANGLTEYDLRIFSETWVEPVLRQIIKLVQRFETDTTLLSIAAGKAKLYQRFGIDQVTDDILEQELTATVNVGIGSTDPMQQVQRFGAGLQILGNIPPHMLKTMNLKEVISEIFGKLGYRDGERFFNLGDNPEIQQLQMIIEELQGQLEGRQLEAEAKIKVAEIGARAKLAEQQMEDRTKLQVETMKTRATMLQQFRDQTMAAAESSAQRRHASGEADAGRRHDAQSQTFQAGARLAERREAERSRAQREPAR